MPTRLFESELSSPGAFPVRWSEIRELPVGLPQAILDQRAGETTVASKSVHESPFPCRESIMIPFVASIKRFLVSEDGPTAVEYAVMLALIIVVCLTAIQAVGTNASTTFTNVSTQLGGS